MIVDRSYDLSHLDSFTFEFVVSEKDGRPQQVYAIQPPVQLALLHPRDLGY